MTSIKYVDYLQAAHTTISVVKSTYNLLDIQYIDNEKKKKLKRQVNYEADTH